MNSQERFHQVMQGGCVDRVPLFNEGLREETLEQWQKDGLPPDESLEDRFRYDRRFVLQPELFPKQALTCREDLEAYTRGLDPRDSSRWPENLDEVLLYPRDACVIGVQAHIGLFEALGVENWDGFKKAILLMVDDPGLVRKAMDRYAGFVLEITQAILDRVQVDYVSFSEPIGANRGPLLSPRMYRELALESYQPVIDFFKRRGIDTIVFTTYANARLLLRDVVAAGFNTLWAMESESTDMDYRDIRREFGQDLRLIGGIDLDVLLRGPDAIRRELSGKVPPLLASGGYIPLADGRVRANMPFKHYAYYRNLLESLVLVNWS